MEANWDFSSDIKVSDGGEWELVDAKSKLELKVVRVQSPALSRLLLEKFDMDVYTYRVKGELKSVSDFVNELFSILFRSVDFMADHILKGWKNFKDPATGKIIDYSFDNALEMLTSYPNFRDSVGILCISRSKALAKQKKS